MNTHTQLPAHNAIALDDASVRIGVAWNMAQTPYVPLLALDHPVLFLTVSKGLELLLQKARLLVGEDFIGVGLMCDGIILFQTSDREAAVKMVRSYIREMPPAFERFATVAWFDECE